MINRIKSLGKDELVRGSFILVIMIGLFNVLNYVFQMSMARMLGPADYGVLAVLMSLVYIYGIPSEAIQTIVTKYTSRLNSRKQLGKIKDLFIRGIKNASFFAFLVFITLLFLSIFLSYLLKINYMLILVTNLLIFYSFILPVARGILQGRKKFLSLGLNLTTESSIKVVFSIALVLFGLKVYGAMAGVITGGIIAFLFILVSIKEISGVKRVREKFGRIYLENIPILVAISVIVLIYSLDIILARIFFSPEIAGKYAFVSLIGKAILFSSLAVGKAMFPMASQSSGKNNSLLKKSLMIVIFISVVALFFYFIFPEQVVRILSLGSSKYIDASNILFISGVSFSFLALSNIIILNRLSGRKVSKAVYYLPIFVLVEVILLSLFNSSLFEFSAALMVTNILIFLYSVFLIRK